MAADGVATYGVLGTNTIRQTTDKLHIIGNSVIIGTAGPVGLGQKFHGSLDTAWTNGEFSGSKGVAKAPDAMGKLEKLFRPHLSSEIEMARQFVPLRGPLAHQAVNSSTLVAMPVRGKPELIQFNEAGATECATDGLPFVAVGSGQMLADPFLAFIRRIFWKDRPPKIEEGVFAVCWTLHHAIATTPGGVGDPIQVVVLEGTNARELPDEELEEHRQLVQSAENYIRTYRDTHGEKSGDVPAIPAAPTKATS